MSGNEGVEALGIGRGAIRNRLERLAGELHQRFGQARALGDRTVERGTSEFALQLQILGRRLRLGERADRVRRLLDAIAAGGRDVLADRAGAFAGNAAGLDDRLDIGTGEIGELFGDLLAALGELLAAFAGFGENRLERRERRERLRSR